MIHFPGVLIHSKNQEVDSVNPDFIKLTIVTGKSIQFQFSAGNGPKSVQVDASYRLNDDNWHSVLIEINRKEARLIIDEKLSSDVKTHSMTNRPLNLNITPGHWSNC